MKWIFFLSGLKRWPEVADSEKTANLLWYFAKFSKNNFEFQFRYIYLSLIYSHLQNDEELF